MLFSYMLGGVVLLCVDSVNDLRDIMDINVSFAEHVYIFYD
jgi:hypothetical protein